MPTRYNNDAVCATHNITLAGAGGWVRGKGSSNDGGSNPIVVLVRWERGWRRQSLRGSKRRQGGFPWYDLLQQQQQYGPATPHDLLRVGKGARTQQLQTSHFYGQRFFFFFEGRLRRCLAEEKQRRFGSGGVLFVKPVWRAVLLHFFIFCFFVIFCDGHTLHIIVGSQKKKFPYYYSYSIIAIQLLLRRTCMKKNYNCNIHIHKDARRKPRFDPLTDRPVY